MYGAVDSVVSNAGGLAPAILAGRLSELAERLGLGAGSPMWKGTT